MKVIGITGKIGSGKTTVAKLLEKDGATRIDCDEIVNELYQPGEKGSEKIQTFFGGSLLLKNGSVNRNKLTRILIKSSKKWEILNRIIHPLVAEKIRKQLPKCTSELTILEIPIYNERLFKEFIDELWIIEAPSKIRHKRLQKRFTQAEIEAIEKQQEKAKLPKGIIISNHGTKEELEAHLKTLV